MPINYKHNTTHQENTIEFMTPTEKLTSILTEQYISEDGDEYKVELKEGLTNQQIDELAKILPTGQIPTEIRELLQFASGFEYTFAPPCSPMQPQLRPSDIKKL